ncbi:MAG: MBOAT family protein [Pseudomonadales bacterium]|nr:MBOAT family protein [Pseudomonadales bacterium]
MIFSSNVFLFVFLPSFLACYYLTPNRFRSWPILIGSYLFYAWWRIDFLALFAAVTVFNFVLGHKIHANRAVTVTARRWLQLGLAGNLGTLAYFKYANFGADTVYLVLTELGTDPWLVTHVVLPIGISFYIFQAISYLVDVYRGDTPPTQSFIRFAAFIALFPQLIAGPVLRYKDVADQFESRTHSMEKFSQGCERFMVGFIKKVIIADTIAPLVDTGFAVQEPSLADAWLAMFAYTAQLYFDFSGYADMAIGLGLMLGFRFVENFNQPYISQSITEFWRRWHISLSNWLRDYLYIPLGGNRGSVVKTYRNLFLTMLLGGLWHGANWTFVVWGAYHGTVLAVERLLGVKAAFDNFNIARWLFTLLLVMLGWVVFRADSISAAAELYLGLINLQNLGLSSTMLSQMNDLQLATLIVAWVVIVIRGLKDRIDLARFVPSIGHAVVPVFALAVLKLSAQSHSPFLYFQF